MSIISNSHGIEVFATCPQIPQGDQSTYSKDIISLAQWSEKAGCRGILVYTDNQQYDPWTREWMPNGGSVNCSGDCV
jgi:hypothetical protein